MSDHVFDESVAWFGDCDADISSAFRAGVDAGVDVAAAGVTAAVRAHDADSWARRCLAAQIF